MHTARCPVARIHQSLYCRPIAVNVTLSTRLHNGDMPRRNDMHDAALHSRPMRLEERLAHSPTHLVFVYYVLPERTVSGQPSVPPVTCIAITCACDMFAPNSYTE